MGVLILVGLVCVKVALVAWLFGGYIGYLRSRESSRSEWASEEGIW